MTRERTRWRRQDKPVAFTTDSGDNRILFEVAKNITERNVPGLSIEIGTRAGGGSATIIRGLLGNAPRTHIALDPYGSIDYDYSDHQIIEDAYPNAYRDAAIPALFSFCAGTNVDFLFFQMTDKQFFKRFKDGVPIYRKEEYIENKYALVFFDGPHTLQSTMEETKFFEARASVGAGFIYDDVEHYYDHSKIQKYLTERNWRQHFKDDARAIYHKEK